MYCPQLKLFPEMSADCIYYLSPPPLSSPNDYKVQVSPELVPEFVK